MTRWLGYSLVLVAFATHFVLSALFVAAPNPLHSLTNLHKTYIGRWFYQDWGLFAPDPIAIDVSLYGQCLGPDGNSQVVNLTAPVWQARKENPFSKYDRLSRVLTYQPLGVIQYERYQVPYAKYCQENSEEAACKAIEADEQMRSDYESRANYALVTSFCHDLEDITGASYDRVKAWVGVSNVKPWSERYSTEPVKETLYIVGESEMIPEVAGFGIWR